MKLNPDTITAMREEAHRHLTTELLPFWMDRCLDRENGGYLTHFDKAGNDTGVDEKSLVAQARTLFTMASAHRAGYGEGACAEYAQHGARFLIEKMWDSEHGGFFWTVDRRGDVTNDAKILYGHSFALYALGEYSLATGDAVGRDFAERTFTLIQGKCSDARHGGYFEMFARDWLKGKPGPGGGDRKTLDVHMHLMEAFSTLYECTHNQGHRAALGDVVDLLLEKMLHPRYGTGMPQFTTDWRAAPQIRFDIVWGHDRFAAGGSKPAPEDTTSFGHNLEFAWLLLHAQQILGTGIDRHRPIVRRLIDHAVKHGIDREHGGVYVEGPHGGGVHDREKEFWQQAEALIALLDAYTLFGDDEYWDAFCNVHRFVFDKAINRAVGEWWPLLTREGKPIRTYMGDSWKINYHTVRAMIQTIRRLDLLATFV